MWTTVIIQSNLLILILQTKNLEEAGSIPINEFVGQRSIFFSTKDGEKGGKTAKESKRISNM